MFQNLHRTMTQGRPLRLACQDCDHRAAWDRAEAIARCGPDATPMDLRARLRCSACGSRRVQFAL
jgi:DNA-directed RNA polymerase subunit RPC12/RpoP